MPVYVGAAKHMGRNTTHDGFPKKKNVSQRSKEIALAKSDRRKFIREVLKKWDEDGTGRLSYTETKKWLTHLAGGVEATDNETKWIIALANLGDSPSDDQQKSTTLPDIRNLEEESLEKEELESALDIWLTYVESRPDITAIFQHYGALILIYLIPCSL